jgi:hypothetical protein
MEGREKESSLRSANFPPLVCVCVCVCACVSRLGKINTYKKV